MTDGEKDAATKLKGLLVGRSCVADPDSPEVFARCMFLVRAPTEQLEQSSSGTTVKGEVGVPVPQAPGLTVGAGGHYTSTESHVVLEVTGQDRASLCNAMRALLMRDGTLTYNPATHGTFLVVEEKMSKKAKDKGVEVALEWLSAKFKGGLSHFNSSVASHIHNAVGVVHAFDNDADNRMAVAEAIRGHMLLKWEGALQRSEAMCETMLGSVTQETMEEYRNKVVTFVNNEKAHDACKWLVGYWTFKKRISMAAAIRVLKYPDDVAQAICNKRGVFKKLFAKSKEKTKADELKKAADYIMVEMRSSPAPTASPTGMPPADSTTPPATATPADTHPTDSATPPAHEPAAAAASPTRDPASTPIVLRGPTEDQAFVRRNDLIESIKCALTTTSVVICSGNGGTGKSSIAKCVFAEASSPYTHLVWANADTLGTFKACMADAAERLDGFNEEALRTTEAKCSFALAALQREGVNCLLVLDNVDSEDVAGLLARNFLPAPSPHFHMLVTSRHGAEVKAKLCETAHIIPVSVLTASDAVAMATTLSGAEATAVADFVTSALMGLPLAIVHAAAYARRKGWDACKGEYDALCETHTLVDTSFEANVQPRGWDRAHVAVLGRTIPMCFSLIKATVGSSSMLARATLVEIEQLFGTLAVLAPDDVPVDLLQSEWNIRGAGDHEVVRDAVLRELAELSLIRAEERDGRVASCHMHRLVQLVARDYADALPAIVDRACETIAYQWPAEDLKDIPYDGEKYEDLARLLPHGVAIVQRASEFGMQSTAVARVARLCGLALDLGSGRLAESVDMWTCVLAMADAGVDGVDGLEAMSFLAEMRRLQAKAATNAALKESYSRKADEFIKKITAEVGKREAAGETVMPMIFLNLGFAATGDKAIKYYKKVEESDNKMLQMRHKFNKAGALRKMKKPAEALALAEDVLKVWNSDDADAGGIGVDHPRTAEAKVSVAKCLLATGSDAARAEELLRDALASQRKMTGDVNGMLTSQANLANALVAQGGEEKLAEARMLVTDGLEEAALWGEATALAKEKLSAVKFGE